MKNVRAGDSTSGWAIRQMRILQGCYFTQNAQTIISMRYANVLQEEK